MSLYVFHQNMYQKLKIMNKRMKKILVSKSKMMRMKMKMRMEIKMMNKNIQSKNLLNKISNI